MVGTFSTDIRRQAQVRATAEWPDTPGRWYVLHTRSRQEKSLAEDLTERGIGHFLPLMRQPRYYGRRKAVAELPLFPGYVFLRGTLDEAYSADRTRRVARILEVADQQQLDAELRSIHLALQGRRELTPYPYLCAGTPVEVRAGPLKGLRGVVDQRGPQQRIVLQVSALGQAVSLEIEGSLLEPLS